MAETENEAAPARQPYFIISGRGRRTKPHGPEIRSLGTSITAAGRSSWISVAAIALAGILKSVGRNEQTLTLPELRSLIYSAGKLQCAFYT